MKPSGCVIDKQPRTLQDMAAQITMRDFEIENLKGQLGIEVTRRREMDRLLEKA